MVTLIITSLIAAFVAGIAALFAPCCITVLLPTYLASIFRQRKTVIAMTAVFFLGLLVVFLPLGLGIAAFGTFVSGIHDPLYYAGSLFLVLLGISLLLGKHFSLPFHIKQRGGGKVTGAGSVFILGIFSGFATLCCAPVLAGVLALSVLPGSLFWGTAYAVFYVLGMVVPLFALAYITDKSGVTEKLGFFQKRMTYRLAGHEISIAVADLIASAAYLTMGIVILYLTATHQLAMGGGTYQTDVNLLMDKVLHLVR